MTGVAVGAAMSGVPLVEVVCGAADVTVARPTVEDDVPVVFALTGLTAAAVFITGAAMAVVVEAAVCVTAVVVGATAVAAAAVLVATVVAVEAAACVTAVVACATAAVVVATVVSAAAAVCVTVAAAVVVAAVAVFVAAVAVLAAAVVVLAAAFAATGTVLAVTVEAVFAGSLATDWSADVTGAVETGAVGAAGAAGTGATEVVGVSITPAFATPAKPVAATSAPRTISRRVGRVRGREDMYASSHRFQLGITLEPPLRLQKRRNLQRGDSCSRGCHLPMKGVGAAVSCEVCTSPHAGLVLPTGPGVEP
ncbi:MAG: hypothetical protein ACJ74D_00265 [Gaiellaceae bacterium]